VIYYFVLATLVVLALPVSRSTSNARAAIAVALVLVVGGLRHEVGTDWFTYQAIFNSVTMDEAFSNFREEPGFLALLLSVSILGGGFPSVVLVIFAIALGTKIWALRLFGADLNAALLVYLSAIFLIYDMNGLRQGLALGFVMLAAWAAYKRRILPFITAMAAAASMHMFALIALPVWVMSKRWLFLDDRLMRLALLVMGCAGCYALSFWMPSSGLSSTMTSLNLGDRYNHFVENFTTIFDPLGPGSLQRILVAMIIASMLDTVKVPYRLKALLYNTHVTSLFIYFLFSFNMEFMARLSFYFKCMDIVTLSLIFGAQRNFRGRCVFLSFLTILCLGQMFQILSIPNGGLLPYSFNLDR
jgi:hypothetical protein